MNSLLEWLLGLERIRWGRDAPLHLKWHAELPPWVIALIAVTVIGLVTVFYVRERTSLRRRVALGTLRCATLALIAMLLCGPLLVLEQNRVEPSHVALLLDTSLSMSRKESYLVSVDESDQPESNGTWLAEKTARAAGLSDPGELKNHSRFQLLQATLAREQGAALRKLLERHVVYVSTFAERLEPSRTFTSVPDLNSLLQVLTELRPHGTVTDLTGAIQKALDRVQGGRLAGVILGTDGRATGGGDLREALDKARDRRIPIYPIRLGTPHRPRDVEIGPIRAEDSVYLQDEVAFDVRVHATGLDRPASISVRLVDERDGKVADTRQVSLGVSPSGAAEDAARPSSAPDVESASVLVELRTKPTRAGRIRYRVEVPPLPNEEMTDNNSDRVEVVVQDTRLRVLFVDGYPRYEYRYLKNALLREPTIELSVLLLDADEAFVQEGTEPIRRFPETPEELNRYDLVLFGDVDPRAGWLTAFQMNMLLDFVAHEGGGFGLISGERSAPYRFRGTPLEKLVAVRIDPDFTGPSDGLLSSGFSMQLTPEGQSSRLLRLPPETAGSASDAQGAGGAATVDTAAWLAAMPDLFWIARSLGPKPGATVLAAHPTLRTRGDGGESPLPMPLVVMGRYGAGRLFYQSTDETWRWRRHRVGAFPVGELLHDTYWVRVARLLSPARLTLQTRRLILRPDRHRYSFGARVTVELEILDPELSQQLGESVKLILAETIAGKNDAEKAPAASPAEATNVVMRLEAFRRMPGSNRFDVTFTPPRPGRFVIQAEGIPEQAGTPSQGAVIRVDKPDLEFRRPDADHETLTLLAEASGGRVLELDELESAFATIRDRSALIPDDIVEPLWDSKLALLLFVLIISIEWTLRKGFGLL